jgi:formylglycine-generating enzyme required for sulfatase activity
MFFPDDRDMRQLCERPEGLLLTRPGGPAQVYSLARMTETLGETDFHLSNIGDILRNFDLIGPMLQANYQNDGIPRTSSFNGDRCLGYLRVSGPWKPPASELPPVKEVRRTNTTQVSQAGPGGLPLQRLDFEVVKLNGDGTVKESSTAHALSFLENLGGGVALEMVQIPEGSFLMGTSFEAATLVQAEYVRYRAEDFAEFWHEGPPHMVKVPAFYMGRFEVTQAQWQAVKNLPKVRIDLPDDPFNFKGDNLPVEYVSWEEATEFCERLSVSSGRRYSLPSEAEWEYACRAGSTSLFHFGDAITTEFANYEGVYPYGSVGWGVSRDHTTPVGSFAPNAFGLYDMHGNVSEFCQDTWHDTYKDAPRDAVAWLSNGVADSHSLRGGTYYATPAQIRAACRYPSYSSTNKRPWQGFRVAASLPESTRK